MTKLNKLLWLAFVLAVAVALVVIVLFLHRPAADIVVDFNGRSAISAPFPKNEFGTVAVGMTLSNPQGIQLITDSNLRGNRIWAKMEEIFKNASAPDYKLFDDQVKRGTDSGRDLMIVIGGSPPSMGKACAMPTGTNAATWAGMAAQLVAHVETTRPGLKYEIWNEPDNAASNCTSSAQNMLRDYLDLYAAAAPQVRKATPSGKIGGPTLAAPANNTATWIPAFLADTRIAPYVNFVSFHVYVTGQWNIDHGMKWPELYSTTIDPNNGIQHFYKQLEALVRKGSQPDAAHTPIFITEYNTNWAFNPSCCQNDPVYGPLWNAVAITELLNSVNDGASTLPGGLHFYAAANSAGYFCLVSGPAQDYTKCKGDNPADQTHIEYPPLLTYQLFCQRDELNAEDGGYVVGKPTTQPADLKILDFFTPDGDSVVLVNPTSHDYGTLHLALNHLGLHSLGGQTFTIANNQLIRSTVELRPRTDGVELTVAVPPYATTAVKITSLHVIPATGAQRL